MRVPVAFLAPLTLVLCIESFALISMRMEELVAEEKKDKFQDVKLQRTEYLLNKYRKENQLIESDIQKEKDVQESMYMVLYGLNLGNTRRKWGLQGCQKAKNTSIDKTVSMQTELKTLQDVSAIEKAAWEAEIAALNEKLSEQSPICNYIKVGSSVPGICPEKKPEPKPEPPKPNEGEKPEPPKPQQADPEAPKPEAPKPEAPKQEAPKPEAPKQEAPKPEAPKPQDPKPEAPKPEAPKPEAPKQEAPKPEAPKPEAPKQEAPKPEDPKPETSKPETSKPEDPKPEAPKPEAPKPEDPKPEAPKPEAPKQEDPKPEAPKLEPAQQ